jgi:hypothetical protein
MRLVPSNSLQLSPPAPSLCMPNPSIFRQLRMERSARFSRPPFTDQSPTAHCNTARNHRQHLAPLRLLQPRNHSRCSQSKAADAPSPLIHTRFLGMELDAALKTQINLALANALLGIKSAELSADAMSELVAAGIWCLLFPLQSGLFFYSFINRGPRHSTAGPS